MVHYISLFAILATLTPTHREVTKAKLEQILSCERNAKPDEVVSLIKELGGQSIIQASPFFDAEYTIPSPVDLLGRPITKISIHKGTNTDGDFFEYGSIFTGESIATVAKLAGILPSPDGTYVKKIGGNDLILRSESGATYITCANDVRTFWKTIKRTWANIFR